MGEISSEEQARRHAMAERIGVAPSAPRFRIGPGRNPYTANLRSPEAQLTPTFAGADEGNLSPDPRDALGVEA